MIKALPVQKLTVPLLFKNCKECERLLKHDRFHRRSSGVIIQPCVSCQRINKSHKG
jgi:hypothetical protein